MKKRRKKNKKTVRRGEGQGPKKTLVSVRENFPDYLRGISVPEGKRARNAKKTRISSCL